MSWGDASTAAEAGEWASTAETLSNVSQGLAYASAAVSLVGAISGNEKMTRFGGYLGAGSALTGLASWGTSSWGKAQAGNNNMNPIMGDRGVGLQTADGGFMRGSDSGLRMDAGSASGFEGMGAQAGRATTSLTSPIDLSGDDMSFLTQPRAGSVQNLSDLQTYSPRTMGPGELAGGPTPSDMSNGVRQPSQPFRNYAGASIDPTAAPPIRSGSDQGFSLNRFIKDNPKSAELYAGLAKGVSDNMAAKEKAKREDAIARRREDLQREEWAREERLAAERRARINNYFTPRTAP